MQYALYIYVTDILFGSLLLVLFFCSIWVLTPHWLREERVESAADVSLWEWP